MKSAGACTAWLLVTLLLAGCGKSAPDQPPPLFPGAPTFDLLSDEFPVESLFGPLPAPEFVQLSYLEDIELRPGATPVEHLFELMIRKGSQGSMGRVRSEFTFAETNSHAVEESLQVADLSEFFTYAYEPATATAPETVTRSYVAQIDQVLGQLFPLAVENRLMFEVTRHYQVERDGERAEAQTLEFAYDMRVDRKVDPANYPSVSLTEPVWVIQILEVDPDGVEHRREAHFSPEIGMPIFDARRRGGVVTTRRLVRWER